MSSLSLAVGASILLAVQVSGVAIDISLTLSSYAPVPVSCPSTPLLRSANGIGSSESAYVKARKTKADASLATWLKKTDSCFQTASLPSVALAVSGGGYRSLLCGAGVIQAFDSRDSTAGTNGIYQSLTYQSGLSGGAWLTSSITGNNWPTISSLKTDLWEEAFQDSLLLPANLLAAAAYVEVADDIVSKAAAGFDPTIVDPYGRLLSYQLLEGPDGGVATRLSSLTGFSNFTSHSVPFPIITARGVLPDQCYPDLNATQWEFSPYEFGSWDSGVKAFTQTAYLGSALTDGSPIVPGVCISNYDNLGYILGTSSDVFNAVCAVIPAINSTTSLATTLEALVDQASAPAERDIFAVYPNPFYQSPTSSLVSAETELHLVDGGEAGQNVPVWPFIQNARDVDVLIISDNSADTTDNFPNGTEIRQTYLRAQEVGLSKMPYIPSVATFVSEGLNKRATFFGCNDSTVLTIVYLPNVNYTYASNTATAMLQYSKNQTDAMIANGNLIATQDGDAEWPVCLGCAVMKKSNTTLPAACEACFEKYCYSA